LPLLRTGDLLDRPGLPDRSVHQRDGASGRHPAHHRRTRARAGDRPGARPERSGGSARPRGVPRHPAPVRHRCPHPGDRRRGAHRDLAGDGGGDRLPRRAAHGTGTAGLTAASTSDRASARTRMTPTRISAPPANWIGAGTSARNIHANPRAKSTSDNPTPEATLDPMRGTAITPTAYPSVVAIAATHSIGTNQGTSTPASTTETSGATKGMMPVRHRMPIAVAPTSSPPAA